MQGQRNEESRSQGRSFDREQQQHHHHQPSKDWKADRHNQRDADRPNQRDKKYYKKKFKKRF
jgi:hypothetical protein